MNPNDKQARQLLAELDAARDIARRTKRAYRYANTAAPILFAVGLTVIVVGSNLYTGPIEAFATLAGFLVWLLAALCIIRCCVSVPKSDQSFRSINDTERDVRAAERAFNDYVIEHS